MILKIKFHASIYRCISHVKLCGNLHGKRLKDFFFFFGGGNLLLSDVVLKL